MCRYNSSCLKGMECETPNEFGCRTFVSIRESVREDIVNQSGQLKIFSGRNDHI